MPSERKMTLKVQQSRLYGRDQYAWGIEEEVVITEGGKEIRETYSKMHAFLDSVIAEYERENAHRLGSAPAEPEPSKSDEISVVERVLIEDGSKGRRVKLLGGKYNEWGVPLYPELWPQVKMDLDLLPAGLHEVKPVAWMTVQKEGGKAKRVISVQGL
jgi:hypothetical protein